MPDFVTPSLAAKLALALATAAGVGAGTAIIGGATTNAVQDQRISNLEITILKIDALNRTLQETSKEVALLRLELEHQRDSRN